MRRSGRLGDLPHALALAKRLGAKVPELPGAFPQAGTTEPEIIAGPGSSIRAGSC